MNNTIEKTEVVDFVKALEESGIVKRNSHKDSKVIEVVTNIISMSEEEHEAYQKESPNMNVRMFHNEYQDWKETYLK